MKAMQKNLRWLQRNRRIVFWFLLCLIFIGAASYGYFVNSAVLAVVRRGAVEKEFGALSSALGEREAEYLREKRSLTAAVARSYGFQEARIARFISQKTVTAFRSGADM